MEHSKLYTVVFATAVCLVAAVVVSGSAVGLRDLQEANRVLDRQKKVLLVAGLMDEGEDIDRAEVDRRFARSIEPVVVDLRTGQPVEGVDLATFDQKALTKDPATSREAPKNKAKVKRLPNEAMVYRVNKADGGLDMLVLPVEGKGLWSTLYGFLALDADGDTIRGLTFYQHGETPGLGGEIDNPRWKALWKGRKVYQGGAPSIRVVKGAAGPPDKAPYEVDGLSGATLTGNGVTHLVQFWLGDDGFADVVERMTEAAADAGGAR
ncbi:MAG: Na(+)-translocating NADH-quinone reductase subunit C [Proteobacteria bacterium]|nr:MAG: Na(+)-translocating NADH-quinone reductase subunit C [Pseudomonadota bacterium]